MSKPLNKQDATLTIADQAGVGILIAVAATSSAAGTVGYAPGAILLTTTTNKLYVNTGTLATATWTIVGTQS
jgi:hypothetical protein